jgi:hypothetical protein
MEKPHNELRPALAHALQQAQEEPTKPTQLDLGGLESIAIHQISIEDERPVDLLGLPQTAAARDKIVGQNNAGKGRPRGVHNHRTQEWINYLLARYPSPLEGAVQMANSPVEALARELHCSRLEAAKIKVQAMMASIPYLHSRLSSVELKPPGAPGGPPVDLPFSDLEEAIDITPASVVQLRSNGEQETDDDPLSNRSLDRQTIK